MLAVKMIETTNNLRLSVISNGNRQLFVVFNEFNRQEFLEREKVIDI